MKFYIKPNEHVFIGGSTGSGKTFLTKAYLKGYKNYIIYDPKNRFTFDPFMSHEEQEKEIVRINKVSLLDEAIQRTSKIIYSPIPEEMEKPFYEQFFKWCYFKGNLIVVVDEAYSVTDQYYIPKYYKHILTRGREMNVGCWTLSQRPSGISTLTMSEATHYFIFRLTYAPDRDKLSKIAGNKTFLIPPKKYEFYYWNRENEGVSLNKLNIRQKVRVNA